MARPSVKHERKGTRAAAALAKGTPAPERLPAVVVSEAIRGVAVVVRGRELAVRLAERARWHREHGDLLIGQLTRLAEVERVAADDLVSVLGRYDSPRNILEKRLRDHQGRATYLSFIRDHLIEDAVYRLDSADLESIDILPSKRY